MITAQEAREIVEQSDVYVKRYLELVDIEIRKQAEAGKKHFSCYVADLWTTASSWPTPDMTPLQARVMAALKAQPNNFAVQWAKDGDDYVPRAYENDPDAQTIQNYCLIIGW